MELIVVKATKEIFIKFILYADKTYIFIQK